ncbi:MAG: hypothetical protein ACO273_03125 [Burkholderiales bacterium]
MNGLIWFLLEVAVAVSLLVGVVWLTWPRPEKDDDGEDQPGK